jgi:hypothetical protein
MANELAEAVKNAAIAGDVAALTQLACTHGGPAVRMDGDPQELSALHLAAAAGQLAAVEYLLSPAVAPTGGRLGSTTSRPSTRPQ